MSIVRVFMNPLDARSRIDYPIEPGVKLIDFLQQEYPDGFGSPLRVFVGQEELDLTGLDYEVKDQEQITMLVMPGEAISITTIIINALIATAIGFVISYIFKPSTPGLGDDAEESPVYSLNPTRNDARLGQPIAVHYGIVSFPPDFAAAPYSFFYEGSNDMYVDELLVIGMGTYAIEDIFIGDTPLSAIEPGAFRYWIFSPDTVEGGQRGHGQTLGVIGDTVSEYTAETEAPWPFYENVFTSPEVDGWSFTGDRSEVQSTPAPISGSAFASNYDGNSFLFGRIEGVDSTLDINAGDTVTLTGTVINNISFVVGSAAVSETNPLVMTLFETWNSVTKIQDEAPLPPGAMHTVNTEVDNLSAGPYRAQKLDRQVIRVDCDIVFPQGLFRIDGTSGNIKTLSVEMEFTHQMIDEDTGDPIGAPVVILKTFGPSKTRVALRATVTSGDLPHGAYETTVRRVTPVDDDSRKTDLVTWTGLKGYVLLDKTKKAYSTVTLMAVRMKATNGIAQAARSRIRVVSGRHMTAGDSRNPAIVIRDIWTKPQYGMGRPLSELDTAKLDIYEAKWAAEGPFFNGSFDTRSTGYYALQAVASLTAGRIVKDGGLTSIAVDEDQPVRKALFTSANIVKNSLVIDYTFDTNGDFQGNEVEWRDPKTFGAKYAYYPEETDLPETHKLFGCTDETYAQSYAKYLWLVKGRRRKVCRFQTELDGLIPRFNDRIGISTPLPNWGQSGVFVSNVDAFTWIVDQPLDWQPANNLMVVRALDGTPSDSLEVSKGTQENMVVFAEVPPEIHNAQSIEPTSYAFGQAEYVVRDFLVTKISPKGDSIVEIESQVYDAILPETLISEVPPPPFPPLPAQPCVITLPTGEDIPSTTIWNEFTQGDNEPVEKWTFLEMMGVNGDSIICNPGGKRLISSNTLGDAWFTDPAHVLPPTIDNPLNTSEWLTPTSWQSEGGSRWTCHLKDTTSGNTTAYQGTTGVGSTSWTVGQTSWWNDGYTTHGSWKAAGGGLVTIGRATGNNLWWAGYDDAFGDEIQPFNVFDTGGNNYNVGPMFKTRNGYVATVFNGSNYVMYHMVGSLNEQTTYDCSNWGGATAFSNVDTDYNNTVLISKGNNTILQWQYTSPEVGPIYETLLVGGDHLSGEVRVAWQGSYWIAAVSNGDLYIDLYHSTDDGLSFVFGGRLILPPADPKTTSSSDLPRIWNLKPAANGWWVAYYIGAPDNRMRIIKWQYGTQTGDCPLPEGDL